MITQRGGQVSSARTKLKFWAIFTAGHGKKRREILNVFRTMEEGLQDLEDRLLKNL